MNNGGATVQMAEDFIVLLGTPYANLVPVSIPSFSMLPTFQRVTLKSWEWTWGRGYLYVRITDCQISYKDVCTVQPHSIHDVCLHSLILQSVSLHRVHADLIQRGIIANMVYCEQ